MSRDLKHLDRKAAQRVLSEINDSLANDSVKGDPLQGEFKGLLRIRVGEYRVIYAVIEDEILVLRIGHRSKVYT